MECFFTWKFNCEGGNVKISTDACIESIINGSKQYEENIHLKIEDELVKDGNFSFCFHISCVSSYT